MKLFLKSLLLGTSILVASSRLLAAELPTPPSEVTALEEEAGYTDGSQRRYIEITVKEGFQSTRTALLAFSNGEEATRKIHGITYKVTQLVGEYPEAFLKDDQQLGLLVNRSTDTQLENSLLSVYEYRGPAEGSSEFFGILYEK